MKVLLTHILTSILPEGDFEIEESVVDERVDLMVKVKKDSMGLVIGKGGSTIRAIRNILKIKATLNNSLFNLQVDEA